MTFTRIRSYYSDGRFTGCEHIYARDEQKVIDWFRKEYPEHRDCTVVAEEYDPEVNPDHFKACKRCSCVHYW